MSEPIKHSVSQSDDGNWQIDTAQSKGNVTHIGVRPERFGTEYAAQAEADRLNAEQR